MEYTISIFFVLLAMACATVSLRADRRRRLNKEAFLRRIAANRVLVLSAADISRSEDELERRRR